jgi:hypothetical protein
LRFGGVGGHWFDRSISFHIIAYDFVTDDQILSIGSLEYVRPNELDKLVAFLPWLFGLMGILTVDRAKQFSSNICDTIPLGSNH